MDNMDHVYTSTTYDTFNPVEFTYKLNANEIEEFVKLRVSNNFLFSGRRNSSMWAWRAILKHMSLQYKMTHGQAAKKWENMKKKYKELKNPPEGVNMFPEMWPHFKLMDEALEGRLAGSAPLLTVLPPDKDHTDYLPTFKPKRRKIPALKSTPAALSPARSEEVSLSLKDDEEETVDDEEEDAVAAGVGDVAEMERAMQEVENERALLESERAMMQSEREALEREKHALERERAAMEREIATLDRDRASLERERAAMERERVVMEREKALLERDRDAVSRDRAVLDRDRARLDRVAAEKERTEGSEGGEDGEAKDRKERFLDLFERLIDKF